MSVRYFVIYLFLIPLVAHGQTRSSFGPAEYELPDKVTRSNLFDLSEKIRRGSCKMPTCHALTIAIGEVLDNRNQRKGSHLSWEAPPPDLPYAANKAREIDASLRGVRTIWPDICRAVVEIGARDEFAFGHETYSGIATAVLDVARHLSRPGLDCLGQALSAMPESKLKQASMSGAWGYCVDERRGEARCKRLKPTDPQFLPMPPSRYVP
jgi:hypothetical protein